MPRGPLDELYGINGDRNWDELTSLEEAGVVTFRGLILAAKIAAALLVLAFVSLVLLWLLTGKADAQPRRPVFRDAQIICPIVVRNAASGRTCNPAADLANFARLRGYSQADLSLLYSLCADYTHDLNRRQRRR